jgi:hypothetical protein
VGDSFTLRTQFAFDNGGDHPGYVSAQDSFIFTRRNRGIAWAAGSVRWTMRRDGFSLANAVPTGGLWLDQQGLFGQGSPLTHSEALEVWATLSQRYAQGASGITFGIINNPKPTSIFNSVEFPTLLQNGDVVNVITGGK